LWEEVGGHHDSGQLIGQLILWLIVAVVVIAIIYWVMQWLYRRSTKEVAFVRTGFLGEKVVIDGGAFVWPIIHDITPVNMNTLAACRQTRPVKTHDHQGPDAGRCRGRILRAGPPDKESVAMAASTLGRRTLEARTCTDCSRASSKARCVPWPPRWTWAKCTRTAVPMWRACGAGPGGSRKNGLELESVAIIDIDQTALEYFNPSNRFDAEGLTSLIKDIEDAPQAAQRHRAGLDDQDPLAQSGSRKAGARD
jgi:uncharacterized membrane protein YqiK